MKWLVTGAGGVLGRAVLEVLAGPEGRGDHALGLDRSALDITDGTAVRTAVHRHRPDVVVNCAAYTAVDRAEAEETAAARANGDGPRLLAEACAESGARLCQVSTDYVFSGTGRVPYREDDLPAPGTAYGRTKLLGERAVLDLLPTTGAVLRTAWLYGVRGRSFVATMRDRAARGEAAWVVDDQYGQPSFAGDVAARIVALGRITDAHGVYHGTNSGVTTWFDLAREVYRLAGADPGMVRPIPTAALSGPVDRPAWTVLGHDRFAPIGLAPLRPWWRALRAAWHRLS